MCCLPHPQGYLARPVTTVWAQGTMISLKLPWSKNPLCQDPFRAVGRSAEAQVRGRVDKGPPQRPPGGAGCSPVSKDSLTLTAQIPFFLENYTDTDPSPAPQHTKPGLQKIQQVRNSVHKNIQLYTSTPVKAKHKETLITVSAFSSQEAKRADGCLWKVGFQEGTTCPKKLIPDMVAAASKPFNWEESVQFERERMNVMMSIAAIPGEDVGPGIHTTV